MTYIFDRDDAVITTTAYTENINYIAGLTLIEILIGVVSNLFLIYITLNKE